MNKNKIKKNKCVYCGDSPINHSFSYFSSIVSMILDPLFTRMTRWVPRFAVNGAEGVLKGIFNILYFFKIIRLSDDIEKSLSLRTKVAWQEAKKRNIEMKQVVFLGKHTDNFRAKVKGKYIYFDSLPIPSKPLDSDGKWDDKFFLKQNFHKNNIPVPACAKIPLSKLKRKTLFERFTKPIIVKPREGSRGRHTTTNIRTYHEFEKAYFLAKEICPQVIIEEHLSGYVCRATCIDGKLVGFYRAEPAFVIGDGEKTIEELIKEKNINRLERVKEITINTELQEQIKREGYDIKDVLENDKRIELSHRIGRYFGGITKEMLDEINPSFIPILEKASKITNLHLVGFDCIVPNPEDAQNNQKWGIIECNTLPFIDLHYFALTGKPKDIAGMIWDLNK